MANLVLNVCFDLFSRHEKQIWKLYKLLKMISFELMHPYNTLNVPQIVKTWLQLKDITITNIWHSTSISTIAALSKWQTWTGHKYKNSNFSSVLTTQSVQLPKVARLIRVFIFMPGSCHLVRVAIVEIGVECLFLKTISSF